MCGGNGVCLRRWPGAGKSGKRESFERGGNPHKVTTYSTQGSDSVHTAVHARCKLVWMKRWEPMARKQKEIGGVGLTAVQPVIPI